MQETHNPEALLPNILVIPAKAGIHFDLLHATENTAESKWIPAFARMTKNYSWSAWQARASVADSNVGKQECRDADQPATVARERERLGASFGDREMRRSQPTASA